MKRYIAKCISFYLLKIIKIYVDFFKKVCIINTGIKEKVDILKMNKEIVLKILELSKQFDKDNYSMRVSGHFDSENEYEEMKLNFILRKLNIQ